MKITNTDYFPEYASQIGDSIQLAVQDLDFKNGQIDLGYSTQASAVYSANIEGNTIDLNSFMNYKLSKEIARPTKELEEIENLIAAGHSKIPALVDLVSRPGCVGAVVLNMRK